MKARAHDGRRFYGLLYVHAELDYAEERLQHGLRLIVAARSVPGKNGLAIFQRQRGIDGVAGPLSGGEDVDVAVIQIEAWQAIVQYKAAAIHHDAAAEGSIHAVGDRDQIAETIGDRE